MLIKFQGEGGIYEESCHPLNFIYLKKIFVNVMRLLYNTCIYAYMYILVNNPEMETSLSVYNISQVIMADKGPEISGATVYFII